LQLVPIPDPEPEPEIKYSTPGAGGVPAATGQRRRQFGAIDDTEIDMTSMIDVVFQLLVFFMVCSVIQSTSAVNVPETKTGYGMDPHACVMVSVRAVSKEPASIGGFAVFVDDRPDEALSLKEAAVRAADLVGSTTEQTIILRAATDAPYQLVRDLLVELRRHTDAVVRTGVREKH
ncbi:MAG: biopolymer transporter ExbD, partial [Phycisphaerae bacterium]|nr:biopolymer transporter ExbD [Phycisphaerae bacterium]